MIRQKITLRLNPQVEALGRKLAKADFGSETKLGVLIEHAIQAYHARQLTELEASGLLSAAERALVERLEKRFDELGKSVVSRVGNLIAKSSFETAYSAIILEELFAEGDNRAKIQLEQFRKQAAERLRNRFEIDGADASAALVKENAELSAGNAELSEKLAVMEKERAEIIQAGRHLKQTFEQLQGKYTELQSEVREEREKREGIERWTRGLMTYIRENVGRMKTGEQGLTEYVEKNPRPKGL